MNLLIVMDEMEPIEKALNIWKKNFGEINIVKVRTGEKALEKIQVENYDLIISEQKLIEGNGLDLLEKIRKHEEHTPFALLVKKESEDVAMRALNLNADAYLKKDQTPKEKSNLIMKSIYNQPVLP